MPHHDTIEVSGRIADVFAHRFVIETGERRLLADLGPKGAEAFHLETGAEIIATGEKKPSELKVMRIALKGGTPIDIEHKPKHHGPKHHGPKHHGPDHHDHHHHPHHPDASPDVAVAAVRAAGHEPLGAPRRKPKHFEVLARSGHALIECHVELDGRIRKEKIVPRHDPKWADVIDRAA